MTQRYRRRGKCEWCARTMIAGTSTAPTKDHVVPKSHGGGRTVWCCLACNQVKGDMSLIQWDQFRAATPEWWRLHKERGPRGAPLYWRTFARTGLETPGAGEKCQWTT